MDSESSEDGELVLRTDGSDDGKNASDKVALKQLFSNKIALLLICVPVALGIAISGVEVDPIFVFVFNFGAIIPLAWLISESTEHLEKIVGPTLGVLLNSTFGNMVEIILSIQAIRVGLVKVVQSSLLGAMLMNLLFVTGCCFVVTSFKTNSATYNTHCARYNLSLLGVAFMGLFVPTGLAVFDEWSTTLDKIDLSMFIAGLLALMYAQWLIFSLLSHKKLFQQEIHDADGDGDEEEDEAHLSGRVATALLLGATVLVAFHCDFLVESIDPVTKACHIKEAFVATVLLPIVGNFSEEIAAISIARKGKLDLAMGVAIGSATQIALMVVPVVVFLGRVMNQPFDLDFESMQVKILLASLIVSALCLQDDKANWLKGTMLITTYIIVAAAFFFIHDREFNSEGEPPVPLLDFQAEIARLEAELKNLTALVQPSS